MHMHRHRHRHRHRLRAADRDLSCAAQTLVQRTLNLGASVAFEFLFMRPWKRDLYREAAALGLQLKQPFDSPCAASISIADWAWELPQAVPPKYASVQRLHTLRAQARAYVTHCLWRTAGLSPCCCFLSTVECKRTASCLELTRCSWLQAAHGGAALAEDNGRAAAS